MVKTKNINVAEEGAEKKGSEKKEERRGEREERGREGEEEVEASKMHRKECQRER